MFRPTCGYRWGVPYSILSFSHLVEQRKRELMHFFGTTRPLGLPMPAKMTWLLIGSTAYLFSDAPFHLFEIGVDAIKSIANAAFRS